MTSPKPKTRASKAYLVVGSAHLGVSSQILKVLQQVKTYFNAEVLHLGRTVTPEEKKMWDCRKFRTKTWEKEHKEKESERKATLEDIKDLKDDLTSEAFKKKIKALSDRQKADRLDDRAKLERLVGEMEDIEAAQQLRVDFMKKFLGEVTFVTNEEISIESALKAGGAKIVKDSIGLSKHLYCGALPANGEKVSNSPITRRILRTMRNRGKSWIVPHPIPALNSFPREGLNNAFCYYSTGSLLESSSPKTPGELYLASHSPAAVIALIDQATGEFHAVHLHVDYVWEEISHRNQPVISMDGLIFTARGVSEAASSSKATFLTDSHSPHNHPGVLAATQALNTLHQPETFIDGGDTADFESVCRHTKYLPGAREGRRLIDDLASMKALLDAETYCPSIKKRVLLDSNHAAWLADFVLENPSLIGMCDWKTIAKGWPEWEVIIRSGEDKIVKFFDYVIRHGDMEKGINHASALFQKYLCGHHHAYNAIGRCVSVGPGCTLGLSYLQSAVTAWQNQITTLTAYKGVAAVCPKIVLHDDSRKVSRFSYRNEIYQVEW